MMQSGWKLSAWMPASKPLAATASLNERSSGSSRLRFSISTWSCATISTLAMASSSKIAQGHSVLLEEPDQVFPGNSPVLRSGNAVSLQPARIEPLADGARGHLTDLGDLTSCEDLHRRLSDISHVGLGCVSPSTPLSRQDAICPWFAVNPFSIAPSNRPAQSLLQIETGGLGTALLWVGDIRNSQLVAVAQLPLIRAAVTTSSILTLGSQGKSVK